MALDVLGSGSIEVSAYAINQNGTRGVKMNSAQVGDNGTFSLQLPAGDGNYELAAAANGANLTTGSAPAFRTRFSTSNSDGDIGINVATELMSSRMDKMVTGGTEFSEAMLSATAEIRVTTGSENALVSTHPLDESGTSEAAAGLSVFEAGLKLMAESKTANKSLFLTTLKSDFLDGTLDGRLSGKNTATMTTGSVTENLLSPHGFEKDLSAAMKQAIQNETSATVTLNEIPSVSGYHSSTISYLSASQKAAYQPTQPSPKLYFVDFKLHGSASVTYSALDTCMGPFSVRRIDERGQVTSAGGLYNITLGDTSNASPGSYHMQSDCSDSAITTASISDNASESPQFYYKVLNLLHKSLKAEISNKPFADVDIAYLHLMGMYNGNPIGTQVSISIIDDYSKYPLTSAYIGDGTSAVSRETCHPIVAAFSNPYLGSVYPNNVTLNPLFNQDGATNDVTFFSNSSCTSAITQLTIAAGNSHQVAYVKVPSNYTPNYVSIGSRFIIAAVITPSSITETQRAWSYATPP